MNIVIEYIGGLCPVQGEGTISGKPFYFRARHGDWTFDIAETRDLAIEGSILWEPLLRPGIYYHATGDDPDGGYMEPEEADRIIREHAAKWAALQEIAQ